MAASRPLELAPSWGLLGLPTRLGTAMAVHDTARMWALAQDCQLRAMSAYVDLAMRSGLALATKHQAMAVLL